MAELNLRHIYKVYPNGLKAVNDFNMDIADKEFIIFVGPSGCGKSTTLRMIAGLEAITAGELLIDGEVMNDTEPKDRNIAMVFQNYALYPHMSVYENIAFGLKIRKLPKEEIDQKVKHAAEILGLTDYLKKKPKEMSGGQRQRVALGRAIVREPKVFLLDEPLSNLDAKLRTSMRSEILKLYKRLQTTFIYVTHDQTEAMTMGTRVVVMKDGFIQQIDSPRNLYNYPVNKFVAGFIGTPQMNFYEVTLKLDGDNVMVRFDNTDIEFIAPYSYFYKADKTYLDGKKKLILGIRSEHISSNPEKYPYKAKCYVSYSEDLGLDSLIYGELNINASEIIENSLTKVILRAPAGTFIESGSIIDISIDLSQIHIFDAETEQSIAPRIPVSAKIEVEIENGILEILNKKVKLPKAITLADGRYEIVIPIEAMSCGDTFKAKLIDTEEVNGQKVLHFEIAGNHLFVKANAESMGNGINIDLKLCTFLKDGEQMQEPLQMENTLPAVIKYNKKPLKDENRKFKFPPKYDYQYYFKVLNSEYACDEKIVKRIATNNTSKPFENLELKFSPYAVKFAEEGVDVQVEEIVDYESEKFVKCKVLLNGEELQKAKKGVDVEPIYSYVNVALDGEVSNKSVKLAINTENISVYSTENNIRLI